MSQRKEEFKSLKLRELEESTSEVMFKRLAELYASRKHADCKFLIGQQQTKFEAHKLILAMASKYFEKLCFTDKKDIFEVPDFDVERDVFDAVLKYIYINKFPITLDGTPSFSIDKIIDMWYFACLFELKDLSEYCCNIIPVNSENAFKIYNIIHHFEKMDTEYNEKMFAKCSEVVAVKTEEALASAAFLSVKPSLLEDLFGLQLNIKSELVIFLAFDKYATNYGWNATDTYFSETDLSGKSQESLMEIKELRRAMKQIRFLRMSLDDFEIAAKSGRLTKEEVETIRTCLRDKAKADLPATFTSSADERYFELKMINYSMIPGKREQASEIAKFETRLTSYPTVSSHILYVTKTFILMGIRWKILILLRGLGVKQAVQIYLKSEGPEDESNDQWKCHAQVDIQVICSETFPSFDNIPWFCFQKGYTYNRTTRRLISSFYNSKISFEVEASLRRPTYNEDCNVKIRYNQKQNEAENMRRRERREKELSTRRGKGRRS